MARHFVEEIEHLKKGAAVATGIPLGLTGTPGRTGAAIGQDNEAVFGGLLDMTTEEIRSYIDAGATTLPASPPIAALATHLAPLPSIALARRVGGDLC